MNNFKHIKSILQISLFMIIFGYSSFSQVAVAPALGNGTENSPYEIASLENLYWISQNIQHWDKHFIQTANIDASQTRNWNSGEGWEPIGVRGNAGSTIRRNTRGLESHRPFTGSYNGNNHYISGLYINRPSKSLGVGFTEGYNDQALFGYNVQAEVENLGVLNVNISGRSVVGAVVGYNVNSVVSNCYSSGNLSNTYWDLGGLVGYSEGANSVIEYCYSTADLLSLGNGARDGLGSIGGLAGVNLDGSVIRYSFSTGSVNAENQARVGGLVGYNRGAIVENSYSKSSVSGERRVGGLVGRNELSVGLIEFCYSTGNVSGNSEVGGFLGSNSMGNSRNNYWDNQTSNLQQSVGAEAKITSQMKLQSTFVGWDFNNIWNIDPNGLINDGYPYLFPEQDIVIPEVDTFVLYIEPQEGTVSLGHSHVGELIPVSIYIENQRGEIYSDGGITTLIFSEDNNFSIYLDSTRQNRIPLGEEYSFVGSQLNIFVSSDVLMSNHYIEVDIITSIAQEISNLNSVSFSHYLVDNLTITWVENNVFAHAQRDTVFLLSQEMFSLFATVFNENGDMISNENVIWGGTGVFDGLSFVSGSARLILNRNSVGSGRIYAYQLDNPSISDTTGVIHVFDHVHRIYILKKDDWTASVSDTLKCLSFGEGFDYYLSSNQEFISIGVDTSQSNHNVFPILGTINIEGLRFISYNDSISRLYYSINDVNRIGEYNASLIFADKSKNFNINVLDPVDNIKVKLESRVHGFNYTIDSDNHQEVLNVDIESLERVLVLDAFYFDGLFDFPIDIQWEVETRGNISVSNNQHYGGNIEISIQGEGDITVMVQRNGVEYSFTIRFVEISGSGIYPNPILKSMFKNTDTHPTIRFNVKGDVKIIEATLFDAKGNFVNRLSGTSDRGGDFTELELGAQSVSKVFESKKWKGKNIFGNQINTGVYVVVLEAHFYNRHGVLNKQKNKMLFYFIND